MGFSQSNGDPCIYYKGKGEEMVYMGVYVDDIILAAKTESKLEQEKKALAKKFNIKDLKALNYFLGMKVEQNEKAGLGNQLILRVS